MTDNMKEQKTYKVKMSILGLSPKLTEETDIVQAESEKQAIEDALWHRDGYGITDIYEVNREYGYLTEEQIEGVKGRVSYLIGLIIPDHVECGDVTQAILKEVCEDIGETADWSGLEEDEWCEGDVDIAVSRVMYSKVFPNG